MQIRWAARSHPGLRRSVNEDSYAARPDLGLFVVADGMGGHVAGEIASRLAVEAIEASVAETRHLHPTDTWPVPFDPAWSVEANRLRAAFALANRQLATRIATAQELKGMATTAAAVLVGPRGAVVAHVGDSRVYLFRRGALTRLTRDHSWVEDQVRAGTLSVAAAEQHPWRHVVTRALAGGENPEVDVLEVELREGDRLLVCSDGLVAVVPDERIGPLLGASADLEEVCGRLIAAANDAGGPDNITTLVLQLDAA